MVVRSSRLPGLHTAPRPARLDRVAEATGLSDAHRTALETAGAALGDLADRLSENVIGTMNVPLGLATNLVVDGRDVLVPMATEESSVIAAVCNGARQCREAGGVATSTTGPLMIAQIQLLGVADRNAARLKLLERRDEIGKLCDAVDPPLVGLGGGFRDLEVRLLPAPAEHMLVVHLIVDTRDAMGANAVNSMAEALAPKLEAWTGGTVKLRILTNLADRRLARARAVWPLAAIGGAGVRDGMLEAARFALADPYRATTHNKGIMNGVSAVALATGNDTRAIEAGAHAFAARDGAYRPLSRWETTADGDLAGVLEMPMAVGIVGGATRVHPTAQACLGIMGVDGADALARVMVAVGLVQNFSALKALATTGIQKGHMALHAQNVAMAAGAEGAEVDAVARALIERGAVRHDLAEEILRELRAGAES